MCTQDDFTKKLNLYAYVWCSMLSRNVNAFFVLNTW